MLTIKEIKEVLRRERIGISKYRGQNFLVDANIQKKLIQATRINPTDQILEIGPGLGALTEDLAKQAQEVIAVEKDKGLFKILQRNLNKYSSLKFMRADILDVNINKITEADLKVIGNLPYYISTPIIGYLLEEQRNNIAEIFITVQREVGKRLVAETRTKDYSSLSIMVQYFTDAKILFAIPKKAFYPQPRVDSVFVRLAVLPQPRVQVHQQEQFFKIVQACFQQRRKTMANSLAHRLVDIEKEQIACALKEAGIDPQQRPETVAVEGFAELEHCFYKRGYAIG
ncbi:16S rRNA (adenine(1518)-N(6)/adenine(1519)-N(6))-dimethyltransferase RsmA [Candidatus Omnitrophota bacterium]